MDTFEFEQKLLSIRDVLRFLAYRLTGSEEETDDLVQETMLKALVNRELYHNDMNFNGWVYTIMRHIFINDYRAKSKRPMKSELPADIDLSSRAEECEEWMVEDQYDSMDLKRLINVLPEIYRLPILMYLSGFKYREIADKADVSINTIKSRIFLGKKLLKKWLDDRMNPE